MPNSLTSYSSAMFSIALKYDTLCHMIGENPNKCIQYS